MKKTKIFISVTVILVMMLVSFGAQASSPLTVTTDPYTGKIIVNTSFGTNHSGDQVSVEVYESGDVEDKASDLSISSDALADSMKKIKYFNQAYADSDGSASFSFPLANSGSYIVRVQYMYASGDAHEEEIEYYSLNDARSIWASLVADPGNNLPLLFDILNVTKEKLIAHENDDYLHELISGYDLILSDGNFNADSATSLLAKIENDCDKIDDIRALLTKVKNAGSHTVINSIVTVPANADLLEVSSYIARYNALSSTKLADLAVAGKAYNRPYDFAADLLKGIEAAEKAQTETNVIQTPSRPLGTAGGSLGGSVVAPVVQPSASHPFTDISGVVWAKDAITSLYNAGIISGKSSTEFAPNDNITREEFVKIALGVIGISPSAGTSVFGDVDSASWYAPYVNAAVSAGVISGYSENMFGVGDNITRQDVAVILNRIHNLASNGNSLSFTDSIDISDYAKEAVDKLSAAGVINGSDGRFMPKASCTRAEAACMVHRMMSLIKEGK